MKKNLVLTIVTRYTYNKIEPFSRTLRETGFDGDLVVFYDNLSEATVSKLKQWKPILIKFDSNQYELKNIPIFHYRFYLFYDYLKKNRSKYDKVLLCDMRDVVFQKDPFLYKGYAKINFFLEGVRFKESNINSFVLEKIGGDIDKCKDEFISCAGTTIGDVESIKSYVKIMSNKLGEGLPLDQGLHNYLIYSNKFHDSKIFKNFMGPVLTISNMKKEDLLFDQNGNLINKDGTVINIIHQYDRFYSLGKKFYRPSNFYARILEFEFIKFKRSLKMFLFNLPIFGRYFRKKYRDPTQFN